MNKNIVISAAGLVLLGSQMVILTKLFKADESIKEVKSSLNIVTNKVDTVSDKVAIVTEKVKIIEKSILKRVDKRLQLSKADFDCLAKNVYHEAGIESKEGKIAVAQVTMNRVNDKRWGNTVCKTVYSKAQFSWTLKKKNLKNQPKGELWERSLKATTQYVNGYRVRGLENSMFYHTDYIKEPYWVEKDNTIMTVGQHIFYTEAKKL